jgi:hypothetical protein
MGLLSFQLEADQQHCLIGRRFALDSCELELVRQVHLLGTVEYDTRPLPKCLLVGLPALENMVASKNRLPIWCVDITGPALIF